MKLSVYLKKQKLTRQEFARLIGCDPQTVWVWLKGGKPSIKRISEIEKATERAVTMEDFL